MSRRRMFQSLPFRCRGAVCSRVIPSGVAAPYVQGSSRHGVAALYVPGSSLPVSLRRMFQDLPFRCRCAVCFRVFPSGVAAPYVPGSSLLPRRFVSLVVVRPLRGRGQEDRPRFATSCHTSDLHIGALVSTPVGAWRCRVRDTAGRACDWYCD